MSQNSYTGPSNYHNPYEADRAYSPLLSSGLSSNNPIITLLMNALAGDKLFPQPTGNNSAFDMMLLRSRNLDYHHIMRRATASMQMAKRMGGIDENNPLFAALAPTLAAPDSALWRMVSPFIGGNPVRAQMGLYADFTGQANAFGGRFGSISAAETDRLMDSVNQQFYRPANFGTYMQSVADPLRRQLGAGGYDKLSTNWSRSAIDNLEGVGFSRSNTTAGNALDRALSRIQDFNKNTSMSADDRAGGISNAKKEAYDELWKTMANSVKSPEVRQKLSQDFSKALENGNASEFKQVWSSERQNVFRMADRGLDILQGKIPGGIDYQLTRGFKLEDLTGALGIGFRSGMVGFGGTPNVKNLGGMASMMDAARGLFGNDLSGRDLMKEMNNLVGIGSVDITNAADTSKMEKLLWNVKAMSRTAGVSINAVRGIIEETKNLAAAHGTLISGQTAMGIGTESLGRTTAAMSYMDPSYVRRMGGPAGLTAAYNAGTVAAAYGSPLVQQLGALRQLASLQGGDNSPLLGEISKYAASGDVTAFGAQRFFNSMSGKLGMTPQALNSFVANNEVLSKLGLEADPSLREAGRRSAGATLFQRVDQQMGASGLTEMAMRVANDSSLYGLSDAAFDTEVGKWMPNISSASLGKLRGIKSIASRNRAAGRGVLTATEVFGAMGYSDINGELSRFVAGGGDVEIARRFSPDAQRSERALLGLVKTSASFDARISRQMGAIHAGMGERIAQGLMDGSLSAGGTEGFLSMLAGGPISPYLIDAHKNLAEVAALRAQMGPNADPTQAAALLNRMLGSSGATGEQLVAMTNLVGLGSVQGMSKSLALMDRTGGAMASQRSGTEALHAFMALSGSNPQYGAHIKALTEMAPKSTADQMAKAFYAMEQERLTLNAGGDITAAGGQGSGAELLRAARALSIVDPENQMTGALTTVSALDAVIANQKFAKIEDSVKGEVRGLYGQAGTLLEGNTGDPERRAAMVKLYGESGGHIMDYVGLLGKGGAGTLQRIADAADPAEALALAGAALGTPEERARLKQTPIPGSLSSPATLVAAAQKYRSVMGDSPVGEWSQADLLKEIVKTKQREAQRLTSKMGRLFHGDYFWGEAVSRAKDGMPSYVTGELGILERELGGGALGANVETLSQRLKTDKKFAEHYQQSTHAETRALLEDMISKKDQASATEEEGDKAAGGDPFSGLTGVIEVIRSLVTAIQDATKTP